MNPDLDPKSKSMNPESKSMNPESKSMNPDLDSKYWYTKYSPYIIIGIMELAKAKKIVNIMAEYTGTELKGLVTFIMHKISTDEAEIHEVVDFIQLIKPKKFEVKQGNIDLCVEFAYNYQVSKAILKDILDQDTPNNEELRKTLVVIQKYMDSMLKMQEKMYNVQQIQKFQDAVMEVLQAHQLKDVIVEKLLELTL